MGHWGFVFMAYGIVWCSILLYVTILRRRIIKAEHYLDAMRAPRANGKVDEK